MAAVRMTRHSKDGPILYKCRSHGRQARCPRTGTAGANDGGDAVTKPRAGGIRVGSGSSGTAHLAIGGEQQVPSLRARSSGPCKEGGEWTWAVEGSALNLSYMLSATTGHVEATAKKVQGQVARPGCKARLQGQVAMRGIPPWTRARTLMSRWTILQLRWM